METIPYTWKCLFVRTTNLRKPAYVNQKSSAPHSFRSCNSYTGPQATEIDHPHHPGPKTAISLCTWGLQKGAWEQSAVDDGAKKKHGEVKHICVKLLGFWQKHWTWFIRGRSEWIRHPSQASYKNPQTWTLNFEPIGSEPRVSGGSSWQVQFPKGTPFLLRIESTKFGCKYSS